MMNAGGGRDAPSDEWPRSASTPGDATLRRGRRGATDGNRQQVRHQRLTYVGTSEGSISVSRGSHEPELAKRVILTASAYALPHGPLSSELLEPKSKLLWVNHEDDPASSRATGW